MRGTFLFVLILFSFVAIPDPSSAQTPDEPDTSKARLRLGPVALNPTLQLTNLGVDTNVFNEEPGQEKRDFTFTVSPRTDVWLKMGRTWIASNIREDLVWFQKYAGERTANSYLNVNWIVPLNRLKLTAGSEYINARERPGFEIDARSSRSELMFTGSVEYRAFAKTFAGLKGRRQEVAYDRAAIFQETSLHDQFNRVVTEEAVVLRHQATPLTAVSFDVALQQDRFEFSSLRDSDSRSANIQVTFDPFALIKGSARFGLRDFRPVAADLPGFRGGTAAVDLSYTLLGTTRFGAQINRDIQYSYDERQPYYVQTGFAGTISQQIFGPVDGVVRAGRARLAYQTRRGVPVLVPDRTDRVHSIGGGLGYHLGTDLRVGVMVERQERNSDLAGHSYSGLRVGASVTYGS